LLPELLEHAIGLRGGSLRAAGGISEDDEVKGNVVDRTAGRNEKK
jgi:hypothetical protein